ncbi:DsbA family protein [Craterilacuibacter sp.]|uniref:DsbA family protein n=1 Tax=Craterilacuibacter sp. TaxID=2870909 RepID=UPI003F32FDED
MKRRTVLAGLSLMPLLAHSKILPDLEQIAENNRARQRQELGLLARQRPEWVYNNRADPFLGDATASQIVIYFTDFNCPYCRRMDVVIERVAQEQPDLKFVFKLLTLFDASSEPAALLALNVWQAKRAHYWDVHQALMQGKLPLDQDAIAKTARAHGSGTLLMPSKAAQQALADNQDLADKLKVFSTPCMLIGDRLLSGTTDSATLKRTLREARKVRG